MNRAMAWTILSGALNVAAVLLLAPLFQGILRKITARIQSRQGPPVWQPYFDLLKLLGKEDIESGETPTMQRFAAYLSLATVLTLACLVPMGVTAPMNGARRRHPADLSPDAVAGSARFWQGWRPVPPTRCSGSAAK